MHQHNPDNPEIPPGDKASGNAPSSYTPEWLSEMRLASASSLQASVFYQAGYEAARQEIGKAVWRRASFAAIAASVTLMSVSGAMLFQLGKQNGQSIAVSKKEQEIEHIDAPEQASELRAASATPIQKAPVGSDPSLMPSWLQSQFSRMLPNANTRMTLLGPGVELGRAAARLDEIIVLNRTAERITRTTESEDANESAEPQSFEESLRGSFRVIRDNRIKSLMESLL